MILVLIVQVDGKIPTEAAESMRLLKELHHLYAGVVYSKCLRMLRDKPDAQDAVQETFVTAYRLLDRIEGRPDSARLPWLYRIATHVCLHALRTRRRKGLEPVGDALVVRVPQTQEREIDMRRLLDRLLGEMDERGIEILVAHYIDGMTQQEIADALGISRRAVVKRLTVLRKRVAVLLKQEDAVA